MRRERQRPRRPLRGCTGCAASYRERTPSNEWQLEGTQRFVSAGSQNGRRNQFDASLLSVFDGSIIRGRRDSRREFLSVNTLNEVFSTPSVDRRYEVWFVRLGLGGGPGA